MFCYVIEKHEKPSDSGSIENCIDKLETYNMHTDANTDRGINTLLSD